MNLPPGPDQKRPRKSGAETPTLARDLLPKPVNPNGGSPIPTMGSSPALTTGQKKRGRPLPRIDVERKTREAIDRGDIIPPTPRRLSPVGLSGKGDRRSGMAPVVIMTSPPARSPALTARDHFPKPSNVYSKPLSPISKMASLPSATTIQKKRGRPLKSDVQRMEAIERGEILPPAPATVSPVELSRQDDGKSSKSSRRLARDLLSIPAQGSALTPGHILSPQMGPEHTSPVTKSEDPPGKKRKPRLSPEPKVRLRVNF